ncbi:MAG: T9SS type A sorting domain-containing protein [Bacteroidota bacterium]
MISTRPNPVSSDWRFWIACFLGITLAATLPQGAEAGLKTSAGSGTWTNAATWTPAGAPGTNDDVVIARGHTVTLNTNSGSLRSVLIQSGATLTTDGANRYLVVGKDGGEDFTNDGLLEFSGASAGTVKLNKSSQWGGTGGTWRIAYIELNYKTLSFVTGASFRVDLTGADYPFLTPGAVAGVPGVVFNYAGTASQLLSFSANVVYGSLWISNAAGVTMNRNLTTANLTGDLRIPGLLQTGSYTITGGATRTLEVTDGGTLRLQGTSTLPAGFSTRTFGTTSTVEYAGSSQSLGAASYGNLLVSGTGTLTMPATPFTIAGMFTLAGSSGVTLAADVTVLPTGGVTLSTADLSTGPHLLTVQATAPSSLNLGTRRIFGQVSRAIAAGSTAAYAFLTPNTLVIPGGTDNPSSITMAEYPGTFPPNLGPAADTLKTVKRYYAVTGTGAGSAFSFALRLAYLQGEARGTEANYTLWRDPGTGWNNMGSSVVDPAANYVQQGGLTGFSSWAIAESDAALPIQLAFFTAVQIPSSTQVLLTWRTISETNNYGFFVQRRASSGGDYADLPGSFIPGQGTTVVPQDYSWVHAGAGPGVWFYRLKQVDLDGSVHFHDPLEVVVEGVLSAGEEPLAKGFRLDQNYPNPFNPHTTIRFSVDHGGQTRLTIVDVAGRQVAVPFDGWAEAGESYLVRLDASALPSGTYFYRVTAGGRTLTRAMTLIK